MYIMYKYITYGIVVILVSQRKLKKWEILSCNKQKKYIFQMLYLFMVVVLVNCSSLMWLC